MPSSQILVEYDKALYQEPGMCIDGARLLLFPDGTEKLADMALFPAMWWTDPDAEYNLDCPEIPQIECEMQDDAQSVLPQELAESQEPEEPSSMVRSEQCGQGPWLLAPAPWQLVQVSEASQARKGGKPPHKNPAAATPRKKPAAATPRKKPAAATRTAPKPGNAAGKPPRKNPAAATHTAPEPGNAAGKPPRKEPAAASLTAPEPGNAAGKPPRKKPAAAKFALTPDLRSDLQKYVDGRIAKLQDEPGQFRTVKNGKLSATKKINKNIPPGSLLCIYDAPDAPDHRVAGDRQFTKTTGADADARRFCMCVPHFHAVCEALTTAGPAGAKP